MFSSEEFFWIAFFGAICGAVTVLCLLLCLLNATLKSEEGGQPGERETDVQYTESQNQAIEHDEKFC